MAQESYNVPQPDDRTTIVCLYCEKPQEVSRKAMSVTCKFCSKSLKLEDIRIKAADYTARRVIDTCGTVTIEKKGHVVLTDKIHCGGLVVRGKLKSNVTSRGPVFIGPEAEVRGNITAPSLAVGAGAILEGRYEIGTKSNGEASEELVSKPRGSRAAPPPD
jgi:cytoskeletal protein CcmA (bactofilin family)